jgi:hypothetical protein
MASKVSRQLQARTRERERRVAAQRRKIEAEQAAEHAAREQAAAAGLDRLPAPRPPIDPRPTPSAAGRGEPGTPMGSGKRPPGQQLSCGWCGTPIAVKSTGRLPKWCSPTCRQRAWETDRAARSGQAAVKIVDRYIAAVPDTTDGWINQFTKLAGQIEHSASLDLDLLGTCLDALSEAITNHTRWHDQQHRY